VYNNTFPNYQKHVNIHLGKLTANYTSSQRCLTERGTGRSQKSSIIRRAYHPNVFGTSSSRQRLTLSWV